MLFKISVLKKPQFVSITFCFLLRLFLMNLRLFFHQFSSASSCVKMLLLVTVDILLNKFTIFIVKYIM